MDGEPQGLKVKDFLGVFYRENGRLKVSDEFEGSRDVEDEMSPFLGRQVRLVVHHRPVEPIDETRWGGGCCYLEPHGSCPFGHHQNPQDLFVFNSKGVLQVEDCSWVLDRGEGKDQVGVPMEFLEGHRSQILILTVPDEDDIEAKMKGFEEKVKGFEDENPRDKKIDELMGQLTEMRDFLDEINKMKDNLDG